MPPRTSFSGGNLHSRRSSKRLSEYPKALFAAAACVGCVVLWMMWGSGSSSGGGGGGSSAFSPRYEAAAAANITGFRNRLLSELIPTFSTRVNATVGFTHADWTLFSPSISCPPDRPLKRYGNGTGDGTKLLCAVEDLKGRGGQPCVIYSMGSAGNFLFEQAMLEATTCDIYTFDCTFEGSSIHPRHTYYKWCIGNPGLGILSGLTFKTWDDVTLTELHHDYVNLLKIDIEGHEYDVLAALQAGAHHRVLPDEISIEIHARYVAGWAQTHLEGSWQNGLYLPHTPGDMGLVFMHLANQGYGVYMAEENFDWFMCCSEFSLLRIPLAAAAAGVAGGGGGVAGGWSHRGALQRLRQ